MEGHVATYTDVQAASGVQTASLNEVLIGVKRKDVTLHQFVDLLGPSLTTEDEKKRQRGTRLLSLVLARVPDLPLNDTELDFMADFFTSRLADFPCITDVLDGIHALLTNHKVGTIKITTLTRALFAELFVQSLPQPVRHTVFQVFHCLLTKYLEDVTILGGDMVHGYIQAMDGEKDPRNLTLVFRTIPLLVKNIPEWTRFAEDIYEVTSCYFPITFTPPPNDPHGITKDDLVLGLRACIVADAPLMQYTIPFLIEKLEATTASTKIETMKTMTEALKTFHGDVFNQFYRDLWQSVRNEVVHNKDLDVQSTALATITTLVQAAASASAGPAVSASNAGPEAHHPLQTLLSNITQHCVHVIKDMSNAMAPACVRLLHAAARACYPAASQVVQAALPQLLSNLSSNLPSNRAQSMAAIAAVVSAAHEGGKSRPSASMGHPASTFAVQIYEAVVSHLAEPLTATAAVTALTVLVTPECLVSEDLCNEVVSHLTSALIRDLNEDLTAAATAGLVSVASSAPRTVLQGAVSSLMGAISNRDETPEKRITAVKAAAAVACASQPLATDMLTGLAEQLHCGPAVCQSDLRDCLARGILSIVTQQTTVYSHSSSNNNNNSSSNSTSSSEFVLETALPALVQITSSILKSDPTYMPSMRHTLSYTAQGLAVALRSLSPEQQQQQLSRSEYTALLQLTPHLGLAVFAGVMAGLHKDSPAWQTQLVTDASLALYTLASNTSACAAHDLDCHTLYNMAGQGVASLVNKSDIDTAYMSIVHPLHQALSSLLQQSSTELNITYANRIVRFTGMVIKGLCMAGRNKKADPLLRTLEQLLSSEQHQKLSLIAAQALAIPVQHWPFIDGEYVVVSVRPLWQQRYFVTELDQLRTLIEGAPPGSAAQQGAVAAVAALAASVPQDLAESESEVILPLMLVSISTSTDGSTLAAVLQYLAVALGKSATQFQSHIGTLLPRFIVLAHPPYPLECRQRALQCITLVSSLPYQTLFPYKDRVIDGIYDVLDDKKRLVRKEAVAARNAWMMLS